MPEGAVNFETTKNRYPIESSESELLCEPIDFDPEWFCEFLESLGVSNTQLSEKQPVPTEAILVKIKEELAADFPEYWIKSMQMDKTVGWIHVGDRVVMLVQGHREGNTLECINISLVAEEGRIFFYAHAILIRDDVTDCQA